MTKFVALFDLHWGYERRGGHKVALHDQHALDIALAFIEDFKPDTIILGGDMLDCGAVSHHNKGKAGRTEGLRILSDAHELRTNLITPVERVADTLVYIEGNHESWLHELAEEETGLIGLVEPEAILKLKDWKVIPEEGIYKLGKLTFAHGQQMKGGDAVAKAAVIAFERSVRFGHHHTYQTYTKTSAIDLKQGKTGVAVPCLCTKGPKYGEGAPNRWVQGFNWGYVQPAGDFTDYVSVITDKGMVANGKVYR